MEGRFLFDADLLYCPARLLLTNKVDIIIIFFVIFANWIMSVSFIISILITLILLVFSGQVEGDEVVDSKILQYCSIDKKEKKSLGELEQEFLQALQVSVLSVLNMRIIPNKLLLTIDHQVGWLRFDCYLCLKCISFFLFSLCRLSITREKLLCQMRNLIILRKNWCGKEAASSC